MGSSVFGTDGVLAEPVFDGLLIDGESGLEAEVSDGVLGLDGLIVLFVPQDVKSRAGNSNRSVFLFISYLLMND